MNKRIPPLMLIVLVLICFAVTANAAEYGEVLVKEDSASSILWTIGSVAGEDEDIDTSVVFDCQSYSSVYLQAKFQGGTGADADSNAVTVVVQFTTQSSPDYTDWTIGDSMTVGDAEVTDDTSWVAKPIGLPGAKKMRFIVYPTAANLVSGHGAIGYLRFFWTRELVQKPGRTIVGGIQ